MRDDVAALLQRLRGTAAAALRLEPLLKIESQLLLPALQPGQPRGVALAQEELELLRDLLQLAEDGARASRGPVRAAALRLASLHHARIDELLQQSAAAAIDWRALLDEAEAWLAQWALQQRQGSLDDEDRDPVGQRPR